jgi:hypothetical protein
VPLKFPAEFKIINIPQKIQNVGALFGLKKLSAFSIYEGRRYFHRKGGENTKKFYHRGTEHTEKT